MTAPAVVLEKVTKSYLDGERTNEILKGASLTITGGERIAIVGPSGSGKSTLLHLIGGLDRRYGGTVRVAGEDLARLNDVGLAAFRARNVGFVFQSFNLLPHFSALENVLLPGFFGTTASHDRARAQSALERVGLGAKTHRAPGELSGGERQRVAIARALFARPSIVLADEPTGNLDASTGAEVIHLFEELNRTEGVTLVTVTHEDRVSKAATRVLRLTDGQLTEEAR